MKAKGFFQNNKYLFFAGLIMLAVAWVNVTLYVLTRYVQKKQEASILLEPVHAPAPAMNMPTAQFNHKRNTTVVPVSTHTQHDYTSALPSANMTGTMVKLNETSSTSVSHIGGGIAPVQNNVSQGNTSNRSNDLAMNTNFSIPVTSMIYLHTAHSAVTTVGAPQANEVVNEKMGIIAQRHGEPDPPTEPTPDLDDPTPVGDVAWPLMALLTIGWCVLIHRKRQQACK